MPKKSMTALQAAVETYIKKYSEPSGDEHEDVRRQHAIQKSADAVVANETVRADTEDEAAVLRAADALAGQLSITKERATIEVLRRLGHNV